MPTAQRRLPSAVPIWLDCDPGNDDAFAILLAAFHPSFHLCGISTVHGNVSLKKTTRNTLAILEKLRFTQGDIPVFAGEASPLSVAPIHAEAIHGTYGIGGTDLPEHPGLQEIRSVTYLEAMKAAVEGHNGKLCIVCTGALTNVARFLEKYPGIASKIRLLSIMGGAFNCGNIAPNVEFNIRADPHAAAMIFECPDLADNIVLAPLNVTHTALATDAVRRQIYDPRSDRNSEIRRMFSQILGFYNNAYVKKYGHTKGPPIHDPLALFLVLPKIASEDPNFAEFSDSCDFHYLQRHLKIDTDGVEVGRTKYANLDMDPLRVEKGGVYVAQSVNIPLFWKHIFTALALADEHVRDRS